MKNKILFVCFGILSLFINGAIAQVPYGPKAGVNISTITGNKSIYEKRQMIAGIHLGGFVNILEMGKKKRFCIQPEILFNMKGSKFIFGQDENQAGNFRTSYLDIPVLVVYKANKSIYQTNQMLIFSISAGPYFGFLLSTSTKTDSGKEDPTEIINYPSYCSPNDVGIAIGTGFQLKNGLNLNLRLNKEFSRILTGIHRNLNHLFFSFSVGYKIGKD